MKTLSTTWVARSRRKFRSSRGENAVEASCKATTLRPRTSAITVTTVLDTEISIVRASSAVPWKASRSSSVPRLDFDLGHGQTGQHRNHGCQRRQHPEGAGGVSRRYSQRSAHRALRAERELRAVDRLTMVMVRLSSRTGQDEGLRTAPRPTHCSRLPCSHGVLPQRRGDSTQASHPVPAAGRESLLRGADGRGGLLIGLLAALPPRHPSAIMRLPPVGTARPVHHPQPPA